METASGAFPASMSGASTTLFKQVLDNLLDGVYFADLERRITYWNSAAERLTGYSAKEVIGRRCADNLLIHVDEGGCLLCESDCPLSRTIADGLTHRAEVFLHHKNGHRVPVEVRVCPIWGGEGEVVGAVEIFSDNSRQRATREQASELAKWAFLDTVSQVANRRYLEHQLSQQFAQHSQCGIPFGIVLADLDNFKKINDTYGHSAGDVVLITVAKTLSGCLRASDVLGRWGGDEFLAILPYSSKLVLANAAERCRTIVARSTVPVKDVQIQVTISVGAAIVGREDSPESLLERADQHLYLSKQSGRNRVSLPE